MNKVKIIVLSGFLAISHASYSANCKSVEGNKIVTYGGLSCSLAKKVFLSFQAGKIPNGWTCGRSVGGCGKGKKGFTFKPEIQKK